MLGAFAATGREVPMNIVRFIAVCSLALGAAGTAAAQQRTSLAPVFAAAEGWLNGAASPASLKNKVVVVDVFTFGCFNCKNVVPELRALETQQAKDVAVIGVHSPETPYERERENVVANLRAQGITWPVAIDNAYAIWNAYGVNAWPTQLFFDRHGRLRKTIVGDSQDAAVAETIRKLVAER
ncbi:MAG: thioredoxin family protein [Vulcanimicrobiaceae bacterium]